MELSYFSLSRRACLSLAILAFVVPAQAINRTVGPVHDAKFQNVSRICNGSDPNAFRYGTCSRLIDCVYNHLGEAMKASLGSGTSIAALLPTILALIGSPPLEIVQLALISPHRALATCCFSIGLPSGLFRQLRPLHTHLAHANSQQPRVREWIVPLSSISRKNWLRITGKLATDVSIITLASIMIWQNWVVSSFTMVPWRCEYFWLLFIWPFACITWLAIAVGLIFIMKESIHVYDSHDQRINYSIWDLIRVPYNFTPKEPSPSISNTPTIPLGNNAKLEAGLSPLSQINTVSSSSDRTHDRTHSHPPAPEPAINRSDTIALYNGAFIRVRITMSSKFRIYSWRWYEAIIESLAVVIYLYATFVLTSVVFLNADMAIQYASIMAVCLSAVRILTAVF